MNALHLSPPVAKRRHYDQKSTGYRPAGPRTDRLVGLVGGPGLRVLDVGCGPGQIGALIRERQNYVVGVELSAPAAAMAAAVLDEVHIFDIEGAWPRSLPAASFDVLVLGEVLEHVFDPVAVVREASRRLRPNGTVVITTPNFFAWMVRLQILFGRFRYQTYGVFDFGHIRWFSHAYLYQVLGEAGLSVKTEHHLFYPTLLERVVTRWPSLFARHFIVSARTPAPEPGTLSVGDVSN